MKGYVAPGFGTVARHWPESKKPEIKVEDIVRHTARLPAISQRSSIDDLTDRRMADLLAAQTPWTDPRAAFCYHGMTYGFLFGELVRRVDGRRIEKCFCR